MSPAGDRLPYMPALDGLRALAVGGVLAFHAGYIRAGFLGVDLFFVLSGYLITSLLLVESARHGRIALGRFWARRARRLLPAVLLVLCGVSAYAAFAAAPTELARIRADAWATLLYFANWHSIYAEQTYWALFSTPSPLHHTWSLAIEEQFYLLWPVAMALVAARFSPKKIAVACAALAVVSAGVMAALYHPDDTSRAYYGTDARACALLVGATLAAWTARSPRVPSRRILEPAALVAAAALALVWYFADGKAPFLYRGGFLASELAVAVVLAAASHPEPGALARVLSLAPLRYVGKISYGIYLWHWPVFVALTEPRLGFGGAALLAARLASSFALAAACYHLVELPIRRSAFAGWRMAVLAPAAFAAVGGVVFVATEERAARPEVAEHAPWREPAETERARRDPFRLLVVGDSVAQHLAASLRPIAADLALELHEGGRAGCGLFEGIHRYRRPDGKVILRGAECGDLLPRWSEQARAADVALVLLAAPARGQWEIDGRWLEACDPALDTLFEAQAVRGLTALESGGATVFVATLPYGLGDDWDDADRRRTDCLNESLRRALGARPTARSLDLAGYVCPAGSCLARIDGVLLRRDGLHFDDGGGELVGWWLVSRIREARSAAPKVDAQR
jgi:peptidoglycan/LPS O-acetylase OafA/YrhL